MDKDALLERMHAGRDQWESTLARWSPDELVRPSLFDGWSVKDLIAHVGAWERTAAALVSALLDGRSPDLALEAIPVDDLNARFYAEQRAVDLGDVAAAERLAYQSLLGLVETASDVELFDPERFAWTQGAPLVEWIAANSYEHYEEHVADLVTWLDK